MGYAQLPSKLDVHIVQGDDWTMQLNFTKNSEIMNLTGYTITAYIVKSSTATQAITVTPTNLAIGRIALSLTDAQTVTLSPQNYRWHLEWVVGGLKRTSIIGKFSVDSVTQPLGD